MPADLPSASPASEKRFDRPLILGGLVMILVAAAIIALAAQSSGGAADECRATSTPVPSRRRCRRSEARDQDDCRPANSWTARPSELRAYRRGRFRTMDKDGSGFVEREEAPDVQIRHDRRSPGTEMARRPGNGSNSRIAGTSPLEPAMAKAAYIAKSDADARRQAELRRVPGVPESGFDAEQVPVSVAGAAPGRNADRRSVDARGAGLAIPRR